MRLSTGRWVSGDDFFDRESELRVLKARVRDGNHVLLTGQRRMGKTSIARELGRRLEAEGWIFLFTDVEGATCPEDAIADIARAVHPVRAISSRFATTMKRWLTERLEEISALDFGLKIRAGLNVGSWRRHGGELLQACASHDKPVLLVIDELPIFLKRMLRHEDGPRQVDEFLSWLRAELQRVEAGSLVVIVSGSIGLGPLVTRLGIPDRINHLDPIRLGPWDRETSAACFRRLAESSGLRFDEGVPGAVYEALGIGIPHHVQSFFARLRDFATIRGREFLTGEDVSEVYRADLLGPSGQNDLVHYETRLKDGLDDPSYSIAMEILAEASTQRRFSQAARRQLTHIYSVVVADARGRIADVLEVLTHDGYLETGEDGFRFPSHLLRDWWAARFRDHHSPLASRRRKDRSSGEAR
ncbi:MAG: ATP-binding protein [Acidobacteriota bacterium]|nr:ATP-binding protein [Acidobacteriota bacterium]